MGKRKTACQLAPKVNGEASKFYKEMLGQRKLGRPLANYIYAHYVASNMADAMDKQGYQRNSQGQHSANDVLKFIDWSTIQNEIGKLHSLELQEGFVDLRGNRADFIDAKEALEKADAFNKSHTGINASVVKHGDVYNIIAYEKDSRSLVNEDFVSERLKAWDIYKQAFNGIGVDIENMPVSLSSTFSAYNVALYQVLQNLKRASIRNLYKKDALILFYTNPNSPLVQRLVGKFGSLEQAAEVMDQLNHGINATDNQGKQLLLRALNQCKNFHGLDLNKLETDVKQMSDQIKSTSQDEKTRQELKNLNKLYGIDVEEIHRTDAKIRTLSQAATDAVILLQRQIRQLEEVRGNNVEGKQKEVLMNQLLREIKNKRYYSGLLNFLQEASTTVSQLEPMLKSVPQTGTELEKAMGTAKILQDAKSLRDQYYDILKALSSDTLTIDENIAQMDIDNIKQLAKTLKKTFDDYEGMVTSLTEDTMGIILTQIVGDTMPDGQSVLNAIKMAASDSSAFDWLYSMGKASNPIIGSMGHIIRNAQDERDLNLQKVALRIRRANDKLYKSGSTSEFMYEDDGHIISDIDWASYSQARRKYAGTLIHAGYDPNSFDFKQAMENWEDANTEDRVVDNVNGRTEKVPDYKFRKQFPDLTVAQQEYYDTMMQIKGELGSLAPSYAQHQYLPPQLRRDMFDALGKAKSFKDVSKAFKNKVEDVWTIREDDTEYSMNGIIDGEDYQLTKGSYDNTPLRRIPIFFVKKLKDQNELLKDFSAGVQALAGTLYNYDAMNNVAQVAEFMGDFVKDQAPKGKQAQTDWVQSKVLRVFKDLKKHSKNTNTIGVIDGFIAQHIYGQRLDPNQKGYEYSKLVGNLINYTSFKGLATNIKGAFSNYLMGEYQMLIEAGAGEFYGLGDYVWAHTKLFGNSGTAGEMMELLTNNVTHKGVLFGQMFDPMQENYSKLGHQRYYKSMFRQLMSKDCSFIGYSSGEYLIHYVNMYSILHHQKVKQNGKTISLYDAFEVGPVKDGNAELVLKQGVTQINGDAITPEYLAHIKKIIRGVNQATHGAMNNEDKGLIHQYLLGRLVMNFRQWMVGHYSRRFRKRYWDSDFEMNREGYWTSMWYMFRSDNTVEAAKNREFLKCIGYFLKDFGTFAFRAKAEWSLLDDMQKYNVKRVMSEMTIFAALTGLSFALGDPDEHKKEWWRRWWMYQVRRLILDTKASTPGPGMLTSFLTMLNSPMSGISTMNSIIYLFMGLANGDITEEIQSGDHKGENRYWRNVKKYTLPFYKDFEQMRKLDKDESLFNVMEWSPSTH